MVDTIVSGQDKQIFDSGGGWNLLISGGEGRRGLKALKGSGCQACQVLEVLIPHSLKSGGALTIHFANEKYFKIL